MQPAREKERDTKKTTLVGYDQWWRDGEELGNSSLAVVS